ncbi:MAG: LPS assembly protein LptD [Lentisphaeria bacterium]
MRSSCSVLLVIGLLFSMFGGIHAQDFNELLPADELKIEADELSHNIETGEILAKGDVHVTYGVIQLTAREASINQKTYDYTAQGEVVITLKDQGSWHAPALQGNFQDKTMHFGPFRLDSKIWYAAGAEGTMDEQGNQQIRHGWLTTCDCPNPHYRIEAAEITHHPDQSFTAKHVVLKFGSVPVLYLPWLWGSTNVGQAGLLLKPGYSGKRGAYLQIGRIWKNERVGDSRLYLDLMSKRGVGAGYSNEYESAERELSTQFYALHDLDPTETSPGFNRRFEVEEDRFRVKTYYRQVLSKGLSLRLNLDWLSDSAMLEDWFRQDYRHFEQSKTFADLSYDHDYFNVSLNARPRVNTFYTTVQQLPELRLTIPRLAVLDSPLLYNSENSLGYYSLKWRNSDLDRVEFIPAADYLALLHDDAEDYASFRTDTLHTLSLPLDIKEIVTLTPRASFRATSYSRTSQSKIRETDLANLIAADNPDAPYNLYPVRNYDNVGGSRTRFASEFGLEMKSKFHSDWQEWNLQSLNINGIRHVIEPYLNYTFAPEPSEDRDHLYFFDEIDRLQKQHFLRLGLDQRWQTRQAEKIRTLLNWQSYADVHFDRGEESGKYWGDFGNRLAVNIRPDFQTWAALLYDIGEADVQRGEYGLRYGEEEKINATLRYIYRNDHVSRSTYSMGSSLVDITGESSYIKKYFETADTLVTELYIPIDSRTSAEVHVEYDFEEHRLAEHSYRISRQLHCWTMVLGVGWDYNEFQAMIMFRLTAFPNVKIDLDI